MVYLVDTRTHRLGMFTPRHEYHTLSSGYMSLSLYALCALCALNLLPYLLYFLPGRD